MTDFLADLGRALDDAAADLGRGARPAPRRRLPIRRFAQGLVAAAVGAAAVVIVASRAGGLDDERAVSAPSAQALPADTTLRGNLAVLRRGQTALDDTPAVRRELKTFEADPSLVRVVGTIPGGRPIMIAGPMKGVDGSAANACMYYPDAVDGGGVTCHTAEAIRAGAATASLGEHWHSLVPDGVATLQVSWRDGRTETVAVRDNFARAEGDPFPERIVWFDARGNRIKTIRPPLGAPPPAPPGEPAARLSLLEREPRPIDAPYVERLRRENYPEEVARSARVAFTAPAGAAWAYRNRGETCLVFVDTACTRDETAVSDEPLVAGLASSEDGTSSAVVGLLHDGPSSVTITGPDGTTSVVPVRDNVFVYDGVAARISWDGLDGRRKTLDLSRRGP